MYTQKDYFIDNALIEPHTDYTYDALYRLIKAVGREKLLTATFGVSEIFDNSEWMGELYGTPNDMQVYTQKYTYDKNKIEQ